MPSASASSMAEDYAVASSRASTTTASASKANSFEGRRGPPRTGKENQFTYKNGRKHHAYGSEKAPYPLSYDREVVDVDVIDNVLRFKLSPAPSLATIPAPSRVLDLGCGTGGWAIQAARAWPNAEVVGFDLVNVQINLACVEPSVARRITWQHGNLFVFHHSLSTRLPFEDDYFEHVHIQSISKGVPEHKVLEFALPGTYFISTLKLEIHRVLAPAGSVEIIEDDIIFPVLPRWFTEPLRAKAERSSAIQPTNGTHSEPIPSPPSSPRRPPHEHALLELLFKSVYESRFINLKPTAVLPIYFTPFFSQCLSGSPMILPVPFLAPLPPLP
ncbi:hypothetical protein HETIRDRAFT_59014, partial [Heterobasidion irregulare TC 32-1]